MYRKYRDAEGRTFDQLLVPEKYRRQFFRTGARKCLGGPPWHQENKGEARTGFLLAWMLERCENFVRSCDTCQRVGKSTDKRKSPMRLVPVITEPFRRLVIDIVGPLPESRSGCRYILTCFVAWERNFPKRFR
uniref:Putative retrovirus-related pol polyprotein from transposon n=1 Tax=Rhipicephalus microplus TaxID=6941 RepID=A0A6G5AEK4_RHIMP